MTETKLYCGHGSEHSCAVLLEPNTQVVLATKPVDATAWGDASRKRVDIRVFFVPSHRPAGWTVVEGPDTYSSLRD